MDPRNQPAQDDEDLLRDIRKILDDRHDADDPYERGFADKLYEDCEDPTLQTQQPPRRQQNSVSGPVIHAYNSDFRRGAAPQRREEPTTYLGPVEDEDDEPPRRQSHRSRREPERAPRREEQPRRHRAVPESGYDAEPPKKKKKHRFARGLGKLLLILLVLFAVVIGAMLLLAKQPKAEETLGARRDGCSTILLAGTDKSGDRTDTVMNQDDRIHRILFCCPLKRMIDGILRSRPSRHDRRHLRNPVIQHQLLRIPDIILIHSQINPVDLLMLLKQLQGMDQNRLPVNLKKLLRDTRSHPHSASACKYNCNIHVRLLLIYHISLYHY